MNSNKSNLKSVTIISIHSKQGGAEGIIAGRSHNRVYSVQVPEGSTWAGTLENAFAATNIDERYARRGVDSTSAGDIMILDSTHYLVEGDGYREITPEQSLAIQALTSRDTGMGFDFMVKHNILKA